jgi:hypothetical protein
MQKGSSFCLRSWVMTQNLSALFCGRFGESGRFQLQGDVGNNQVLRKANHNSGKEFKYKLPSIQREVFEFPLLQRDTLDA